MNQNYFTYQNIRLQYHNNCSLRLLIVYQNDQLHRYLLDHQNQNEMVLHHDINHVGHQIFLQFKKKIL